MNKTIKELRQKRLNSDEWREHIKERERIRAKKYPLQVWAESVLRGK